MKKLIRNLGVFGLGLALGPLATFMGATSAVAADHHGLSAAGQGAFEDLARCVRSEDSTDLNIFFLVDSSASLRKDDNQGPGSDPNDKRADILSQTVRQLNSLNDKIDVHFALDTFDAESPGRGQDGKPNPGLGWRKAGESEVNDAAGWVEKNVPNFDYGQHTNWLKGLQNAQRQLAGAPQGDGEACKAIIWFTDGALDVSKATGANEAALEEMCGVSPSSGSSGIQKGVIPNLRANNISLIGVLLAPRGGDRASGLVSYFQPILEGRGIVDSSSLGGSRNQNFECGLNPVPANHSRGAMLVANNPGDLALLFASIPFMVSKGEEITLKKDKEFTVDKGVLSAAVVIPAKKWKLSGPGVGIDSNSQDKNFKIHTVGDISTVEFNIPKGGQGDYKVEYDSPARIAVFLESGVRINLDKNVQITAGKGPQQINGTFSDFKNNPIDINIYDKPSMSVASIDTSGRNRTAVSNSLQINNDGTWSGQVTPFDGATSAEIQISVSLRTKPSGTELPKISQTFNIPLVVSAQYCKVKQAAKGKDAVSEFSPLTFKKSPASGVVVIEGAKEGNCSVRFAAPKVLADPIGRLTEDFKVSVIDPNGGSKSVLGTWVEVPQGQDKKFEISIDNKVKANGETLMSLPIDIRDQAATQSIQSAAKIRFTDVTPEKNKCLWILFLMFISLALPLGLLQLVNHLFARFKVEDVRVSSLRVKVRIEPTETKITLVDGSPISLQDGLFEYLPSSLVRPRKFNAEYKNLNLAKFSSHLPRNPFGNVLGTINSLPGEVIVASESLKSLANGTQVPISLNLNRVFFATAELRNASGVIGQSSTYEDSSLLEDPFGISTETLVDVNGGLDAAKAEMDSNVFEAQLTMYLVIDPMNVDRLLDSLTQEINTSGMWTELARIRENVKLVLPATKSPKEKKPKADKAKKEENKKKQKMSTSELDVSDSTSGNNAGGSNGSGNAGTGLLDDLDDPWA
jgi:hypothetical protein